MVRGASCAAAVSEKAARRSRRKGKPSGIRLPETLSSENVLLFAMPVLGGRFWTGRGRDGYTAKLLMAKNFMDLTGKVAVVMGGTSGIGAMMALGLAEAGADVVPTGRRLTELETVCAKVEAIGRKTVRQTCDVQNRESVDALRDAVLASLGRVDILLNAAGITFRKPTKDVAEADWNRLMDINVTGTLRACQSFYEPLKASGAGRVVNRNSSFRVPRPYR